ncbi:MAG: hypothetical protein WBX22_30330, partial [Silvibacterium sp.]
AANCCKILDIVVSPSGSSNYLIGTKARNEGSFLAGWSPLSIEMPIQVILYQMKIIEIQKPYKEAKTECIFWTVNLIALA